MLFYFTVRALPFCNHCAMSRWKRGGFVQRGGQGHGGFAQRGRGQVRGRGRGRGRSSFVQGRGRGYVYVRKGNVEKSAEQLDKDLDNYHSGAMNV